MKQCLITTLLLLSLGNLFAQLNESDTTKLQVKVSLSGNYQQGNVDLLSIRTKLDISFAPQKNWVFKTQNSSLYQAFYSKKSDNDIFSRNYLYYLPQKRVYPFAIAYISGNFRRKIDLRYFMGVGATWQTIRTKNSVLKCSASAVYESTRFSTNTYNYAEYDGNRNINLWRGTLYLGSWNYLLERRIRIFYDAYWQPAFSNPANYRAQFDLGFDYAIWKGLSLNVLFAYTHENVTVTKVKQDDSLLTFGLAYNLRKR